MLVYIADRPPRDIFVPCFRGMFGPSVTMYHFEWVNLKIHQYMNMHRKASNITFSKHIHTMALFGFLRKLQSNFHTIPKLPQILAQKFGKMCNFGHKQLIFTYLDPNLFLFFTILYCVDHLNSEKPCLLVFVSNWTEIEPFFVRIVIFWPTNGFFFTIRKNYFFRNRHLPVHESAKNRI